MHPTPVHCHHMAVETLIQLAVTVGGWVALEFLTAMKSISCISQVPQPTCSSKSKWVGEPDYSCIWIWATTHIPQILLESRAGRFLVNFHLLTVSQRQVLNSIFAAANLILIWVNHPVVPWDSVHSMGTSHCFKNWDDKQGPKKIGEPKIRTLREGFQNDKNTGIFAPIRAYTGELGTLL